MSSESIELATTSETSFSKHCFLTHDWGEDELGRNNHERVAEINKQLADRGLVTWFDSEQMSGDVVSMMTDGIDQSATVIVFITRRYMMKAIGKGPNGANDNCKIEFDYAARRRGAGALIPVVMEESMNDPKAWLGAVGAILGSQLYVPMWEDKIDVEPILREVARRVPSLAAKLGMTFTGDHGAVIDFEPASDSDIEKSGWIELYSVKGTTLTFGDEHIKSPVFCVDPKPGKLGPNDAGVESLSWGDSVRLRVPVGEHRLVSYQIPANTKVDVLRPISTTRINVEYGETHYVLIGNVFHDFAAICCMISSVPMWWAVPLVSCWIMNGYHCDSTRAHLVTKDKFEHVKKHNRTCGCRCLRF